MSIIVTGGAGFIAPTLIRDLLDSGRKILALDNMSRGRPENLGGLLDDERLTLRNVDLTDFGAFETAVEDAAREGISEVWHLAANSDIPAGVQDSDVDLRDTYLTTHNTLKIMKRFSIRMLYFASSSAIYGDLKDTRITETIGPLLPISNYGAMKLASEAAISAAAEQFLDRALLFRFPNVVGVPATHGVILDFMRRLRNTPDALQVLGNGTQQKAYLHVSELVEAMLFLRENATAKVDIYNIGPPDDGITVREIAEAVTGVVNPRATLHFGSEDRGWVGDVPRFRYDISKLSQLGWTPKLDSHGAIRRAVAEIAAQEKLG